MFDTDCRRELFDRLRRLGPDRPARWGRMTAAQMLAHLIDQMRVTVGELPCRRMPSALRYPGIKQLSLYWLPWPKGKIQGPPEAFTTTPTAWATDLDTLDALVDRFVALRDTPRSWPDHPMFGPLSGRAWGVFCYRHFDHHVRQFGG